MRIVSAPHLYYDKEEEILVFTDYIFSSSRDYPFFSLYSEKDYRRMTGTFDRIVSVGMFEHVGAGRYRTFMRMIHRCLAPEGLFLLHTMGMKA